MPLTEAHLEQAFAELLALEGLGYLNAPIRRQASRFCNGNIYLC